jgi:hypothetical protein
MELATREVGSEKKLQIIEKHKFRNKLRCDGYRLIGSNSMQHEGQK